MLFRYYIFDCFKVAMFYIPVLVVYLNMILAKPIQVGMLLSLKTISGLIFEIPTGFIADRFSRKLSVLIGLAINVISMAIFVLTKNFIWLCFAQILFGIAETFDTGASTSLLYDNLKQIGSEQCFEKAMANLSLYKSLVLFVSFIAGGYIYDVSHKLPFVLTMISVLIAFFVCNTMQEYQYQRSKVNMRLYSVFMIKQLSYESKTVWLNLIFPSMIKAIFYSSYLFIIPLFLKYGGVDEKYFGILFSIGVLVYGFGGKYSGIIKDNQKLLTVIGPILMSVIFFISGILRVSTMCIILLLLMRLVWGAYTVTYNIHINREISDSSIRATAISIGSGIEGGVSSLLIMSYGFISQFVSMHTLLIIISCSLLLTSLFFLLIINANSHESLQIEHILNSKKN